MYLAASLRILANVFALLTMVSALVALKIDTWSVTTVVTPLAGQFTPPTTVEFGLFSYKAYMFGDKYPEVHSYGGDNDDDDDEEAEAERGGGRSRGGGGGGGGGGKEQIFPPPPPAPPLSSSPMSKEEDNDIKGIKFAGISVCVLSLIEVVCCLVYIVYAIARALFSQGCGTSAAFKGDWPMLSEDFILCALVLTALICGVLAVVIWGVTGAKASEKIEQLVLPVEVISADTSYSISYTLAIVAMISAGICSVLQMVISRFNCVDRESGLAGGVIPNYDTFGASALPMHPAPL